MNKRERMAISDRKVRNKINMRTNGKLSRFLNGKGFYVALGVCMIAIGISAWAAIGQMSDAPNTALSSEAERKVVSNTSYDTTANKTESDIPDSSKDESTVSSQADETSSQTAPLEAAAPVAKYFKYPISGEIIKDFSDSELRYSLTYNDMRLHTAVDIKADVGTSVKSCGDGVVMSTQKDPLLGYSVTINHGNGITAVYGGLSEAIAVKKGDTVKSGTNLGPLGTVTTECVDAPHLHLEFYKDDKPIDPMSLITE